MSRRTLLVVDSLGLSGKTKALVDLACGLDPARYRASVCTLNLTESPLLARLSERGIEIHEARCGDGLGLQVMGRLARLFREQRPDVVHCYNPRPMLYGGLVAQMLGIRATVG